MKKSHVKYLITLCILLSSISSQITTNTNGDSAFHLSITRLTAASSSKIIKPFSSLNLTFASTLFKINENTLFDCDEKIEEDKKEDNISQKKNVYNSFLSSDFFCRSHIILFFLRNTKVFQFRKNFSHFSNYKLFIIFQVFRI